MSRWTDESIPDTLRPTGKGGAKRLRTLKRREAEHRNDVTEPHRTRAYRQSLDAPKLNAYLISQHVERVTCNVLECQYMARSH